MTYEKHASEIYYISKKAAELIMNFYDEKVQVMIKDDESPVTHADLAANKFIVDELRKLTPEIAIVSEENSEEENKKAATSGKFWIVDPLDGTKSYIKKTGEFTVNIALVENGVPVGGAIYVPAKDIGYFVAEDYNAYKQDGANLPTQILTRPTPEAGLTVVASKSHRTKETDDFIESLGNVNDIISASSSLKLCLIAEGKADVYPRFGRTMEWDIAAGHAILNAAGGKIIQANGKPFVYGKEDLANPHFIASAS